jgi:thiol-disulfide isomerase/thioredoxin
MILIFVLLNALSSCSVEQTMRPAPDFLVSSIDGQIIWLSNLKGKVVILNFWATWCSPCRQEIPGFLRVYEKYKDKGLEIIGFAVNEIDINDVRSFIRLYKISYPVVIASPHLVSAYGPIDYIPTTYIVNKDGEIVYTHIGFVSSNQILERIEPLLDLQVTEYQ